jgi:hypothetical protein
MVIYIANGSTKGCCAVIIAITRLVGGRKMNIEQHIQQLCKKLVGLGYYRFQVKNIIRSVIGNVQLTQTDCAQQLQLIDVLTDYEKLGNKFLFQYSK